MISTGLSGILDLLGRKRGTLIVSLFRQTVCHEIRDSFGGRRIHVGQNSDDVSRRRTDPKIPVHARRATSVAEAADAALDLIEKAVGVSDSAWNILGPRE